MAYQCRQGGGECWACGECEERPVLEDVFGDPIYEGDSYYEIGKDIVWKENLEKWAGQFERMAEKNVV